VSIAATFAAPGMASNGPGESGGPRSKFNRNHGADGKFVSSSGHEIRAIHVATGENAGGAPVPASHFPAAPHTPADLAHVAGAVKPETFAANTVHVAAGPPLSPADARAAEVAAGNRRPKEAVRVTTRPQVYAEREHGTTKYDVGGTRVATVHGDAEGAAWVLKPHSGGKPGGESEHRVYRSREKAEANAEKLVRAAQREGTTHSWHATADVAATAKRVVAANAPDKHDVHVYVIRGPGGKAKSLSTPVSKDADRGTNADGPAEDDDPHGEDNTYGLPEGRDVAAELRRWFAAQKLAVLGHVATIGEAPPEAFAPLTPYDKPMARAMTPLISAYWDASGKKTMERLGLDPDEWRVTNPHLKAKIREAAYNFCHSTNATTSKRLDAALADLRASMEQGQAVEGETLPQLAERVNGIFEGLSKGHARTIAATEASRAVHAAQETAATEYGDVAGFELLLSSDACPLCRKIFNECPRVRAGQAFAVVGDNETYSTIRFPPLHVSCQCSMTHVFKHEDGGPEDPEWGETLRQPQKDLDKEG
jgi:hypothetical protein